MEVIGWATCWDGTQDAAHRAVVNFLLERGARHHIFSAIASDNAAEVRRLIADNPQVLNRRLSRNENNMTPLHFAVRMRKPEMVALLIGAGADPLAVDGSGYPAAMYAVTPDIDRAVMQRIRALTTAEVTSAERGQRAVNANSTDLLAALALRDWSTAERLVRERPELLAAKRVSGTLAVLHLAAKRGDAEAVKWLLEHGASPNELWPHWDADVTPLHLAAMEGHADVVRLLLAAGGDPSIHDTKHDSDAIGWAEFFGHAAIVRMMRDRNR
jgi:ankyrin repeat protein